MLRFLFVHTNLNVHVIRVNSMLTKFYLYITFEKVLNIFKNTILKKNRIPNVYMVFIFVVWS